MLRIIYFCLLFVYNVHGNVDIPLTAGIPQIIPTQNQTGENEQTLLISKVQHICGTVCQQKILFTAQKAWKRLGMHEDTVFFRVLYHYHYHHHHRRHHHHHHRRRRRRRCHHHHHHHIYYIHYYYYNRLYYKLALLSGTIQSASLFFS
jgi:hypothetical protein